MHEQDRLRYINSNGSIGRDRNIDNNFECLLRIYEQKSSSDIVAGAGTVTGSRSS